MLKFNLFRGIELLSLQHISWMRPIFWVTGRTIINHRSTISENLDEPFNQPSLYQTIQPALLLSNHPTSYPSIKPSNQPTVLLLNHPTNPIFLLSIHSTNQLSFYQTIQPTNYPSIKPSNQPTIILSNHSTSKLSYYQTI